MTLEHEPNPLRRIPSQHPADLHTEIGALLRAARLKRGQTLEAVAQQTRISKRFLEALETDRFEQFPALVYLRGFLKSYCEHLEVDFDPLWLKIQQTQTETAPTEPSDDPAAAPGTKAAPQAFTAAARASLRPHASAPAVADSRPPAETAAPLHSAAKPHDSPAPAASAHSGPSLAGSGATGAIVLAVILALSLAIWLYKENHPSAAHAPAAAPAALQPLAHSVASKVAIHVKSDAWLRVTMDGQTVFEGRAPRGALQEWTPVKLLGLRTTEPSALELTLDGKPIALDSPSPDGEYRVEIP